MSQIITLQPIDKVIDDLEFRTIQFRAYHALGLLPRMGPLGPALGGPSVEGVAPASPETVQSTILDLLKNTSVLISDDEDKPARRIELNTREKIDTVFSGRLPTLFKVVEFVMKANFEVFGNGSATEAGPLPDAR